MDNEMLTSQQLRRDDELNASDHQQPNDQRQEQTPSPHNETATPPTTQSAQSNPSFSVNNNTKNKKLFPQKLWDLINDDKYNFCLRWSEDGQLVYLNRDDFEDSYLKTGENQFHTQKAISFVRQMNMYGFRKVDDCYYENDNFKRDCEYLLKNMIRKHPNKNLGGNPTEITPYIYRNNPSSTSATSTLLQSSAAAAAVAASILAPNNHHHHHHHNNQQLNVGNFIDYSQPRLNQYSVYSSSKPQQLLDSNSIPNGVVVSTNNMEPRHHQGHLLEGERSPDDSLSSVGDYCCSAGSSQGGDVSLVNVLDRTTDSDHLLSSKHHHEKPLNDRTFDLSSINKDYAQQALALYPHLGPNSIFETLPTNSLSLARDIGTPTSKGEPHRGEGHLLNACHPRSEQQSASFIGNSPLYGSFNMNLKTANANTQLLNLQGNTNATDLSSKNQEHNFQSLYNDQKELIKVLMAQQQQQHHHQQSDTQYPRDLSTASSKPNNNQQWNIPQSDDINSLNAFYALLSSLSSNFHQQPSMQAHQNFLFENICQQILTPSASLETPSTTATTNAELDNSSIPTFPLNYRSNNSTIVTQSSSPRQQQQAPAPTKRVADLALQTSQSDKDSSSTSLLARNKFSTNTTHKSNRSLEMLENGYRNGCLMGERSHERIKDNRQQQQHYSNPLDKTISDSESPVAKRRDTKTSTTNRSFKRSVDSILDSNNNNGHASPEHGAPSKEQKRIKIEVNSLESVEDNLIEEGAVNNHAKNLVAQVALARYGCIDPSVISEASKFTQRFVETLFETAQVIARHSNGASSSADTVSSNISCQPSSRDVIEDSKPSREIEKSSAINLNDLTSALKLLPSKISKLLKGM